MPRTRFTEADPTHDFDRDDTPEDTPCLDTSFYDGERVDDDEDVEPAVTPTATKVCDVIRVLLDAIVNEESDCTISDILDEAGLSGVAGTINRVLTFEESGVLGDKPGLVIRTLNTADEDDTFHVIVNG